MKKEIANFVVNSYVNLREVADAFGLDRILGPQIIKDAAHEHGVYECEMCGWWTNEHNLEDHICHVCRTYD